MSPSRSFACSACRISCSKRGVLGWGGLNTTKWLNTVTVLLNAGWPQQVSEAATDDLVLCLCLNILMQKKMRAIICCPKHNQVGLSSKICFVTSLKLTCQIKNTAFVNVCPKTSANVPQPLKRPVSFYKSRLFAANVLLSFIRAGDRSWVNGIHLTETIKRGILRQEHPVRL